MNEGIEFNKVKFKEVLHYIISAYKNKSNVSRTLIFKLLYFNDFDYYELYESSLTGEKYFHKPQGLVPIHFDEAKNELLADGKIHESKRKIIDYEIFEYSTLEPINIKLLTNNELKFINNNLNKLLNMKSEQINNYFHQDLPWKVSNLNEELDYEFVFYRSPRILN